MDPKKCPTPNSSEDEPFANTVDIELDSGDELTESTVCYCPNLPPRPMPKKKGKTVDTVVTADTNIDRSHPERVVSSTDSPPLKKNKTENDDKPCEDCECSPCILDQGLYDLLSEGGLLRDDINYDIHSMRKQIRYDMYRKARNFIDDCLGKGNRKKLPACVAREIHDYAPDNDVKEYVEAGSK
jgi:hypothetical protein